MIKAISTICTVLWLRVFLRETVNCQTYRASKKFRLYFFIVFACAAFQSKFHSLLILVFAQFTDLCSHLKLTEKGLYDCPFIDLFMNSPCYIRHLNKLISFSSHSCCIYHYVFSFVLHDNTPAYIFIPQNANSKVHIFIFIKIAENSCKSGC